MTNEFVTYLDSIGITGLYLDRVKEILDFYQRLFPDQIKDIFVSEYVQEDGTRKHQGLWLFSTTSIMEAKDFLRKDKDDFDFMFIRNQVKYWTIEKTEFDFDIATKSSRMNITCSMQNSSLSCYFKASAENCEHLKLIFNKYILPNIAEFSANRSAAS